MPDRRIETKVSTSMYRQAVADRIASSGQFAGEKSEKL
jgi:hypothetical protein